MTDTERDGDSARPEPSGAGGRHASSADRHVGDAGVDEGRASDASDTKAPKKKSLLREVLITIGIVLVLSFVIQNFVGRQYVVPSASMQPTLYGGVPGHKDDRIVVDKLVYRFGDPERGDVIVFRGPSDSWNRGYVSIRSSNTAVRGVQNVLGWFGLQPPDEFDLVKRVIATGGETVECHNADKRGVVVNGEPIDEPYIDRELQTAEVDDPATAPCLGPDFGPVTVPDGNLWVMGDNRRNSADSRYHQDDEFQGTIPMDEVRGKVRFIMWPLSRIGGLSHG